jgi:hypothetical protein
VDFLFVLPLESQKVNKKSQQIFQIFSRSAL